MTCLCFLEIKHLLVGIFTSIFSQSVGFFVLFIVSFAVHKLISLIMSHLFIFAYVSITLGDTSKKILLQFMSKGVLPVFFSFMSFIVYILIFWSLYCFIFIYSIREYSHFTRGHVAVQFP